MRRMFIVSPVIICLSVAITISASAQVEVFVDKQEMPTARYAMAYAVVDGNIYVVSVWNKGFLKTGEMYDLVSDTWQPKAGISQKNLDVAMARNWFSAAVVDGIIYAIGGIAEEAAESALL